MALTKYNICESCKAESNQEFRCDTRKGSFTIVFPDNPNDQDFIRIIDMYRSFADNPVTIDVGKKLISGSSTFILSIKAATYDFRYSKEDGEWIIFSNEIFSPYIVHDVLLGSGLSGTIDDNRLTVNLDSGVITGSINKLSDGQLLVSSSSSWSNKTLSSTDIDIRQNSSNIDLVINKGNLSESGSSVLTITNGTNSLLKNVTIQVNKATNTVSGYLSSIDWNTFNNKISSITTATPTLNIVGNAINLASQAANTVLAGAVSGGSIVPAFRSLVSSDILPAILSGTFTQGMIAVYNNNNFLSTSLTWLSNTLNVPGTVMLEELSFNETVSNRSSGIVTLGGSGRVTVLTTLVNANSRIFLSYFTKSGITSATLNYDTVVNGVSFRIQSSSTADRSQVCWLLVGSCNC